MTPPFRVTIEHPQRGELPSSVHRTLEGALRAVDRLARYAITTGEPVQAVIRDGKGQRVYHEH